MKRTVQRRFVNFWLEKLVEGLVLEDRSFGFCEKIFLVRRKKGLVVFLVPYNCPGILLNTTDGKILNYIYMFILFKVRVQLVFQNQKI